MVGKAGIEPAISRTPSERSTSEPLPELQAGISRTTLIVALFEQIFQCFFYFHE